MKIRLVAVTLQPELVVDDGNNLIKLVVDPVTVSSQDWPTVVQILADAIASLETKLDY